MGLAFDLQCFWIYSGNVFYDGKDFNICIVQENLEITQRNQQMTSASSISNLGEIKGLSFSFMTVNFVPKFDDVLAKNLKALVMRKCNLKEITREDLEQFPELEDISLMANDLTTLPGNLFLGNKKIPKISMRFNNFKTIGADLLEPLASLTFSLFSNAGCVDFDAKDQTGLEALKERLKACPVPAL
jgi:hypothetical protein